MLASNLFWFIWDSVGFWNLDAECTVLGHCVRYLDKEFKSCLFMVILDVKRFILMLGALPKAQKSELTLCFMWLSRQNPGLVLPVLSTSVTASLSGLKKLSQSAKCGSRNTFLGESMLPAGLLKVLSHDCHAGTSECFGVQMCQWSPLQPSCALAVAIEARFPSL